MRPRSTRAPATVNGARAWRGTRVEGGVSLRAGERERSVGGVAGGGSVRTVEGGGSVQGVED